MGKKFLFFALTFSLCFTINGQTEAEIIDQANKFFKEEKFVEATPLYLRLLSLQPKNIDYNYKYGTCLLFNSNNKQESIRYLKFATESPQVSPDAHFYMGRAYHLNYLFNDAVRSYDKFTSLAGAKESEKKEVSRLIQMCQDGTRLLMNYSEMIVYEKKEIEADKFFRLYDLKDIGGNLIVTADFQSKLDKKNNHTPLIYFPNSATEIYYSSFGEEGNNGKDIYRRVRKATGGWGEPELLKGTINTVFDEDFAYRSQDGKYLYFCSKGHNSMGGYDVFRSIYDKNSDSFLEPENMDFAVSSPDDDIFFLVDKDNQNGYFASARQSEAGKLYVYKIRVEKLPTQLGIIAGVFESKIKSNARLDVEVQDNATGKTVGVFSSRDDGKIIITFPTGGQYKYIMKISGEAKYYTQNVSIPMKKNIKPLRQSLVHFMENGEEVVRVLDRFDETVVDKDEILAALFADKAILDPNSQNFDLEKLNNQSDKKKILEEISASDLTLSEIAESLATNAKTIKDVEKQTVDFEQKTTAQLESEMKKLEEINKKINSNASAYKSSAENSLSRVTLLSESKELFSEKEKAEKRIERLIQLNKKVQDHSVFSKDLSQRADDWKEKGAQLTKLLSEDKSEEALQYISDNKVVIKSGLSEHVDNYHATNSLEINELNTEITGLDKKKYNYETSSKDLQNNIDFLERKLFEGTSKQKEETKESIALKRKDLNLISNEISSIGESIESKRKLKEDKVDQLAEYLAVESSTKPKSIISYQNAKDKWENLKDIPVNADYELLAQAVVQNENGGSTVPINTDVAETKVVAKSKSEWLEEINPKYTEEIAKISNNENISSLEKAEMLLNAERENQSAIKTAIKNNEEILAKTPNNKEVVKNQETLSSLLTNSNAEITKYEEKYENEKATNVVFDLTEANVIESVDKTYADIYEHLNKDLISEPVNKLKSLNEHDNSFVAKINTRIDEVDQALLAGNNNEPALKNEQELLLNLRATKELEINTRTEKINELESQLATNVKSNEKTTFADLSQNDQDLKMRNSIIPDYENKKEEIENAKNSDSEKIKNFNQLNEVVLEGIKNEKKNLNKRTQSSELAALDRLEKETKESNQNFKLDLLSKLEEPKQLVNRLSVDFDSKSQNISSDGNLTPIEREEQQIALKQALIKSLETEKSKFESLSQTNPNNEKVQMKIESIDQVISEYSQLLASNERKLSDLKTDLALNVTPVPNNVVTPKDNFSDLSFFEQEAKITEQISSNYETDKNKIAQSKAKEIVKTQQIIDLDKNFVAALNQEKSNLNSSDQKSEIEAIDRILEKTNAQLALNENKLTELENLALVTNDPPNPEENAFSKLTPLDQEEKLLNSYQPNYEKEKQEISNSKASERIKYNQLLALDASLLNSLVDEKEKLNKTTQQIEIEAIKRIENKINAQIAENQLGLLAVEETEKELVTRLASDYLRNKDQLAANTNLSEVEKAKRQLGVDELLIESLEKEKAKFSALSKSNPSNSELKSKIGFIETVITEKRNEMASLNNLANGTISTQPVDPKVKRVGFASVDELRSELLGKTNSTIMKNEVNSSSIDDLKNEIALLDNYEKSLRSKESELQKSPEVSSLETQNQLNIIGAEILEVTNKKRKYTVTIGDLERNVLAQITEVTKSDNDNVLEKINSEEQILLAKLDGDITSMKEIKKVEKQLSKLSDQKVDRKNELLKEDTKVIQKENEEKLSSLQSIPTSSVAQRINKELAEKKYEQLTKESEALKELAKKSKSREETNELLNKAVAKQQNANEILEMALIDNKVASLTEGKIATLSTRSDLEKKKNTLLLEEASYNSEIKNINAEIKATNKESQVQLLFEKRNVLEKEKQMVVDQIAYLDKKSSKLPSQPEATISPEMKNTELTFREEIEISSSLEFKEISKVAKDATFLENEITFLLKSIDKDKQEAQKLVDLAITNGANSDNEKAELKVKEIQAKENRLAELKTSLVQKQGDIANLFPSDPVKKAKMENLLIRGVEPIRTSVSNYIAIPEKGFEVEAITSKTETKELAVGTKVPSGLMFRVQVGAFSKPVAQDAFQEFNPVTGEKRSNGLTVYMAGFFDKSSSASDAQKTIRGLGYSDAFVVAYCDGERIPLLEGRRMEETKTCAPMQITDLTINRTPTPKDTTKLITRELDYNKGIGAAPAFPVELKKGLFYTVQIGVYNRPVDPETLKNMTPLITKRLPNGQIRYSAGVYVSIEEAMPKRKEAIDKGILDAYITAYYGSERISLEEAEKILQEKGNDVIEKTAIGIVKDVKQRIVAEEKLQKAIVEVEKERFKEGMGVQLVSKETFNEFPRDMLNRFNKHVSFYFDQNDKRLKSIVYTKIEDIPQIHFIREDVDTVFIKDFVLSQKEEKDGFRKIVFYVQNGQLDGDVADFIYRLNFRKEYIEQGENMKVILHSVPSNSIQPISNELRNLKIRSVVE